ncbi:MAG: 1-acyl-sn-glycerol-3-phosphate acyltransferase [Alteromonadaceae bacterium]|nr:1-acyl-sn-glycerol-3-phosphate acyltransferase [Alteromonadaceae bacterium]|tara:strand:- start:832 stop:1566 length:735 start_codon:yes stop_codon:yes gene_type:complete
MAKRFLANSRLFIAWAYVLFISLIGFFLCLLRPFNPGNNHLIARFYAWGGRPILGLKTHVEGREHLTGTTPRVVVANHQSNDDVFLLGDLLPYRTVVIGKSSLRWIPIFGQMFWLGGNVLINRQRGAGASNTIDQTARALNRERKSVWVFPEGTRSKGRGLLPFKRGAFMAAVEAQVPLVMICCSDYQSRGRQTLPVHIRVLEPISTTGLMRSDVPTLMADCHQAMQIAIAELNQLATASARDQ